MSYPPLEWHKAPAAQALIGVIAASGIQPVNRPFRDRLSSTRAPVFHDNLVYDCPEYGLLAELQNQACGAALKAAHAAPRLDCHTKDNPAYADWYVLVDQDLTELIRSEIARRGLGEAA